MQIITTRDKIALWLERSGRNLPEAEKPPRVVETGTRRLEAVFYASEQQPRAAVLLLHGIGDRLTYWREAQKLLQEEGVASLIVAYSGYGRSADSIKLSNFAEDIQAAYAHLLTLAPIDTPLFVLGFSLGTGALTEVVHTLSPRPAGMILCQAFPSLRAAAAAITSSRLLAHLAPDVWPTTTMLRVLPCPLLLVHTPADRLFPLAMAIEIVSAASLSAFPVTLSTPAGHGHNDVYRYPRDGYWVPILEFIRRYSLPKSNSMPAS